MYPTWSAHDGYDYEDINSATQELLTQYNIPPDKLQKFIYPKMPSYVVLIYASDTPNVDNLATDISPNFGLWMGDVYWDSNSHGSSAYVTDD